MSVARVRAARFPFPNEELLRLPAWPEYVDGSGRTPLWLAACKGHREVVELQPPSQSGGVWNSPRGTYTHKSLYIYIYIYIYVHRR
jgi:hypothetical protein